MASLRDQRAGPLSGRSFSVHGFSIIPAPDAARFVFRTRGVAVDTAGRAFGVDLPRQALRTSATSARTAAWIGPDEWLLLGPESEKALIEQQLTEALTGIAHSLVDVSHRDPAIALSGARAAAALNTGCPLDLHPLQRGKNAGVARCAQHPKWPPPHRPHSGAINTRARRDCRPTSTECQRAVRLGPRPAAVAHGCPRAGSTALPQPHPGDRVGLRVPKCKREVGVLSSQLSSRKYGKSPTPKINLFKNFRYSALVQGEKFAAKG